MSAKSRLNSAEISKRTLDKFEEIMYRKIRDFPNTMTTISRFKLEFEDAKEITLKILEGEPEST